MKGRIKKDALTNLAAYGGGFVAGKMLNKIGFIGSNPLIGGAVKLGIGLFVGGQNGVIGKLATGVGICGATELVNNFVPGLGIGALDPTYSNAVYAVGGAGYDGGSFIPGAGGMRERTA